MKVKPLTIDQLWNIQVKADRQIVNERHPCDTYTSVSTVNESAFKKYMPKQPNKMTIRPLTGQVLVEILPAQTQTDSGLFIPNGVNSGETGRMLKGRVVAMGTWKRTKTGFGVLPPFGIGATVLVNPYAGTKLRREIGERLQLVRSDDVVALVEST